MIFPNRTVLPDFPNIPDVHPSHEMSEWETEVLYSYRGPNLYKARQCKNCGAIQGKRNGMNLMDRDLMKKCKEVVF